MTRTSDQGLRTYISRDLLSHLFYLNFKSPRLEPNEWSLLVEAMIDKCKEL